jgi:hypothetical protein
MRIKKKQKTKKQKKKQKKKTKRENCAYRALSMPFQQSPSALPTSGASFSWAQTVCGSLDQ